MKEPMKLAPCHFSAWCDALYSREKGWYSPASYHWNKGCNKNWKELRLELKLWPILCVAYWNQENLTPEFKGICYWNFAGIFSPTKGDEINDKKKNLTDVNIHLDIMPKFNFEKNWDYGLYLQLWEPSCSRKVKRKKVMLKN